MVHLMAESQRWEHRNGKTSMDISRGFDIVDDALFHYLLELGRAGAIEALIGALPSDAFWFGGDDDRRRLRGGSCLGRFGTSTLTDEARFNVDQDTVKIFRFMILADVSMMGLKHRQGDRTDSTKVGEVLLVLEHAEEAACSIDNVKAPSLWHWPEVESFKTRWEMNRTSFHQGMFGDPCVRPSCIREGLHDWSKGWEHMMRSSELHVKRPAHPLANSGMPMVTDKGIRVRKLSRRALEQFRRHCLAGHRPWRPDCAACLDAKVVYKLIWASQTHSRVWHEC